MHASSFSALIEAAKSKSDIPQPVVVNSFDGKSKKKRLKAVLIDMDSDPKLLLEARS